MVKKAFPTHTGYLKQTPNEIKIQKMKEADEVLKYQEEGFRVGKSIMQKWDWDNLKCKCGGEMELIKSNEFEEVKQCKECGRTHMLVKKVRKDLKGMRII